MPSINLDIGFHRHPKVKRLIGLLGRGAEGLLTRLWCHCGEHHCETGILTGYSGQEIESITEWWGKSGQCVDAMLKLGFLDKINDGYAVHDFLEHSGHLRMLKKKGRENAMKRWHGGCSQDATSIPTSNTPKEEGLEGSKNSSKMERREFFNPGVHREILDRAKEVVAYYFAKVAPARISTAATAERLLAQIFLDEPRLGTAEIVAGIDAYAKEVADDKPSMRSQPKKFIEDRCWESYDGRITPPPKPEDRKPLTDAELEKLMA